jgi:aminopeptidase
MTDSTLSELDRYADVIVHVGLNIQPGQRLLVRADIQTAPLVRSVARAAYAAGAPFVDVLWADEELGLVRVKHAPRDSFEEIPAWQPRVNEDYIRDGAALVSIRGDRPGLLAGQDPEAISSMMQALARANMPVSALIQRNATAWAVVAYPTPGWAAQVFPELPDDEAVAKLWAAIAAACRLDSANPVEAWRGHLASLNARCAYMNEKAYTALHYRAPGTDLTLGLPEGHIWAGGDSENERGVTFVANLPTEEIFTMPHRARAEGVLRSSRPLSYAGTLITEISIAFQGGRVTKVGAATGQEVLQRVVDTDEGSARLGEVALVPDNSPISRSGILFANTLFDENAASHLALGSAYRINVANGPGMNDEQFNGAGGNLSAIHLDFMIGSAEMQIDGVRADGQAEPVMRDGEWAFEI